jgi:hypothetical protein
MYKTVITLILLVRNFEIIILYDWLRRRWRRSETNIKNTHNKNNERTNEKNEKTGVDNEKKQILIPH